MFKHNTCDLVTLKVLPSHLHPDCTISTQPPSHTSILLLDVYLCGWSPGC